MAYVFSRDSNTLLSGTSDSDVIQNGGSLGNTWYSGGDNVTIDAGAGDDLIENDGSYATINAGSGNDSIYNSYSNVTINAGTGNDYITNYSGDDVIIDAGAGNDYVSLSAYANNNLIKYKAGEGNDTIIGFDSDDTLHITKGSYSAIKSGSDLIVKVGKGKITLKDALADSYNKITIINPSGIVSVYNDWKIRYGSVNPNHASNVTLAGSKNADTIKNYGSNVKIDTGTGNDLIYSSGNYATISAGAGKDEIDSYGSNVIIDAGVGNDSIYSSGNYATISAGAGNDSIYNDEDYATISAGAGNDSIYNDEDYVTISAGAGNDLISLTSWSSYNLIQYKSGDGKDTIIGFDDSDTLQITNGKYSTTKSGSDIVVTVGTGRITLAAAAYLPKINIDGKKGIAKTNTWKVSGTTATYGTSSNTLIKITGIKSKSGISESNKIITVKSTAIADGETVSVTGSGYKFKLNGTSGRNTLQGGANNDTLTGGGGADLFIHTGGNDIITDYAEQDKIKISANYTGEISGDDIILTTSKGTLTIKNSADKSITINGEIKNFSDDDNDLPTGLSYDDDGYTLTVENNFIAGTIDLSKYADIVDVDASNYRRMDLKITGNEFNNSLVGGFGADTIDGGKGSDYLTGGGGMDIFIYNGGNDIITDYIAGEDKIKLKNTKITDIKTGDNNVVFTTSAGTLILQNAAGRSVTVIDKDGNENTQRYSANIAEIIAEKSVGDFEFENKITAQESLITFAE